VRPGVLPTNGWPSNPWRPDAATVRGVPMGLYLHVPFCVRRCGYCAFSTVAVGGALDPSIADGFLGSVAAELALAADVLGPQRQPLDTIYLGGGTPTMLDPPRVQRLLDQVRQRFELAPGAEVSVESNPDGLAPGQLAALRSTGVNRISFGLQSVRPHVLAVLDRTHDPQRALDAVDAAHAAGFDHVSLDLIHGTPGETAQDWQDTLTAAVETRADHISAYALSIEPGTKLSARVRSGALRTPSGDEAADRYTVADELLSAAGFEWYELSNWARSPGARSRHNLGYWRNHHWWGVGPSAHSHVAGRRWWNHDQFGTWSAALGAGRSPEAGHEVPDTDARSIESVMLGIRLAEGLALSSVPTRTAVTGLVADGLLEERGDRITLTLHGRLLADHVVRSLT